MSVEIIDKRTPELKMLNILETQAKNMKQLYEDFKIGAIDIGEAILKARGIGGNLHIIEKFIGEQIKIDNMKKCSKCNKVTSIDNFYYRERSKDKHQSWCKYCMQVYVGKRNEKRIRS